VRFPAADVSCPLFVCYGLMWAVNECTRVSMATGLVFKFYAAKQMNVPIDLIFWRFRVPRLGISGPRVCVEEALNL